MAVMRSQKQRERKHTSPTGLSGDGILTDDSGSQKRHSSIFGEQEADAASKEL